MRTPNPPGEPPGYSPLPPMPPIFEAASKCDYETVARLLDDDRGLVTSQRANRGDQPLHHAAAEGCCSVVGLLLDRGAQIDAQDIRLMTPLHHAAENAKGEVAQILLRRGADPYLMDLHGFSPLVSAVRRFDKAGYSTARTMLNEGVQCDLHAAVCMGDLAMVRSLLDKAPDLAQRYPIPEDLLYDGLLMIRWRTEDHIDAPNMLKESIRTLGNICKSLVSHGVSPNKSSRWGGPLLHENTDDPELVRFLIDLGADVNLLGPSGERPLQIAERMRLTDIISLLKEHGAY